MAYNYYRSVTINPGFIGASGYPNVPNSDITNYPVYFCGTYSWLRTVANGGHVQSSTGIDIAFTTDTAGTVFLDFERVAYDPTTGAVEFHVRIPNLSSSINTVFYIQYGQSTPVDKSNKNGVWESAYKAVYHFGDGTTLDVSDSTANNNNGTNHGGVAAAGLTGPSLPGGSVLLTAASGQYIDCGTSASIDNLTSGTGLVLQAIVKKNINPDAAHIPAIIGKIGGNGYAMLQEWNAGAFARAVFSQLNPSTITANSGGALIVGDLYLFWACYGGDIDPNIRQFDFHTILESQNNGTGATALQSSGGTSLRIGWSSFGPPVAFFDGYIDEVRIRTKFSGSIVGNSGVIDRVKTELNNFQFTVTFYTIGTENAQTVVANCNNPPSGLIGTAYTQTFTATGGIAPYTWALSSGTLPTGLILSNLGVLSGTPSVANTFNFTLQVTDNTGATGQVTCSITIVAPPAIVCNNPPNGTVGIAYTQQFGLSGGLPPYTVTVIAGTLPPGLSFTTSNNVIEGVPYPYMVMTPQGMITTYFTGVLSSSSGVLTGTPLACGTYTFTLQVKDNNGNMATVTCSIKILGAGGGGGGG